MTPANPTKPPSALKKWFGNTTRALSTLGVQFGLTVILAFLGLVKGNGLYFVAAALLFAASFVVDVILPRVL